MLNMSLLFAYCMNLSSQQMHVCNTLNQQYLDILGSNYLCTFRNLFIDFPIDTPVGQDAQCFTGKILRWAFCPMSLGVLTLFPVLLLLYYFLCKNKVITRNTSPFDFKTYFLRTWFSSHCLWDKGRFAPPKKASCPGYGARRPLKCKIIIQLLLPYITSYSGFIVIFL